MAVRKPSIETNSSRNSFSWLWCVVSIESYLGRKVTDAWRYGFCESSDNSFTFFETGQFISVWYLCARKIPYALHHVSLRSFSNVAFETVLIVVWLTTALSLSSFFRDCLNENCAVAAFYFRPYAMDCMRLCRLSMNYYAVEMTAIINIIIIITSVITFKHRK